MTVRLSVSVTVRHRGGRHGSARGEASVRPDSALVELARLLDAELGRVLPASRTTSPAAAAPPWRLADPAATPDVGPGEVP
jgi:hypothetical protein